MSKLKMRTSKYEETKEVPSFEASYMPKHVSHRIDAACSAARSNRTAVKVRTWGGCNLGLPIPVYWSMTEMTACCGRMQSHQRGRRRRRNAVYLKPTSSIRLHRNANNKNPLFSRSVTIGKAVTILAPLMLNQTAECCFLILRVNAGTLRSLRYPQPDVQVKDEDLKV